MFGKPAIFVPLPNVSNNHQEYNAKVLENVGAAKIILDKNLNSQILNKSINEIIKNREKMLEMGQKTEKIEIKNVEKRIYNEIKSLIKEI